VSTWFDLDACLEGLVKQIRGDAFILTDSSKWQLSPSHRYAEAAIVRFERAYAVLQERFGAAFLRRGGGGRHLHRGEDVSFVAETFLSAYLLIVVVPSERWHEPSIIEALDAAHATVSDLISSLPPIDGGDGAAARAQRP
jgi:hypothetical protein